MSRWDSVPTHGYGDDEESEDEGTASGHNKTKPRRKSHQRPQVRIDVSLMKLSIGQNGSCS